MEIKVNDTRTFKEKIHDTIEEAKFKVTDATTRAKEWVREDPQRAITAFSVAAGTIGLAIKIVSLVKPTAAEMHERRMDKTYYDPSTGMHWDLKRNLTNSDRIEIMERKREGEYTEDILRDMKVLKK